MATEAAATEAAATEAAATEAHTTVPRAAVADTVEVEDEEMEEMEADMGGKVEEDAEEEGYGSFDDDFGNDMMIEDEDEVVGSVHRR